MNNIRQIINERLENAINDYNCCSFGSTLRPILKGQIEAYQDCLNLMQLNDEDDFTLRLKGNPTCAIYIDKLTKEYPMSCCLDMQEHKLLNELFEVWQWV